ncbi:hypothetical protein [Mycolicibacterium palauense]|uniref:hypothetical protein n=1 Tax=Mycolicibacterium palauense TaxID=2034511 RepID=UPI000BFF0551|nr:hypothetical protein [Mycolicibacterium palauense]
MRILLAAAWVRVLCWCALAAVIVSAAGLAVSAGRPMMLHWPAGTLVFAAAVLAVGGLGAWRSEGMRAVYTDQVEGLTAGQRRAAVSAVHRGPAPADPDALVAAIRLGTVYLDQADRARRRNVAAYLGVGVVSLVLLVQALIADDVWALGYWLVLLVTLPVVAWWSGHRVRRVRRQQQVLVNARRERDERDRRMLNP